MSANALPVAQLTLEALQAQHPKLFAQIVANLKAEGLAAGAAAENARIRAVFEQAEGFPWAQDMARQVALESRGTAEDLAQAMVAAQRGGWQAVNAALSAAAREAERLGGVA